LGAKTPSYSGENNKPGYFPTALTLSILIGLMELFFKKIVLENAFPACKRTIAFSNEASTCEAELFWVKNKLENKKQKTILNKYFISTLDSSY
jgi:hypothetical protein